MTVCGMEMTASEVRLIVLEGEKNEFSCKVIKPLRIALPDDENAEEVQAVRDAIYTFLRENRVDVVGIKKRNKQGEFAGGPVSFKLEAIAQLYTECPVRLVPPQSIAAAIRSHDPSLPQGLFKYQENAFKTAFTILN